MIILWLILSKYVCYYFSKPLYIFVIYVEKRSYKVTKVLLLFSIKIMQNFIFFHNSGNYTCMWHDTVYLKLIFLNNWYKSFMNPICTLCYSNGKCSLECHFKVHIRVSNEYQLSIGYWLMFCLFHGELQNQPK